MVPIMRLSMFRNACPRASHQPRKEELKQAVNKGFVDAMLILLTAHLIPVSGALVLVSLNIYDYYIGGELSWLSGYDDVKLSGLKFDAKLHEIAIQGSLIVIVIGLIRQELVAEEEITIRCDIREPSIFRPLLSFLERVLRYITSKV